MCNFESQFPFIWILIWIILLTQTLNTHMSVESWYEGASLLKMTNISSISVYQYPMTTVETSTHGSNLFQYRRFISPDVENNLVQMSEEWVTVKWPTEWGVPCYFLLLPPCSDVLMKFETKDIYASALCISSDRIASILRIKYAYLVHL